MILNAHGDRVRDGSNDYCPDCEEQIDNCNCNQEEIQMRQIDNMTPAEIETLELKGMLNTKRMAFADHVYSISEVDHDTGNSMARRNKNEKTPQRRITNPVA